MRKRRVTWERLEDLVCEAGLFVADSLAVVAGVFYYVAIGFAIFAAYYCRDRTGGSIWPSQQVVIARSMVPCIGTALVWGLAHLVARALEARQTARDAAIARKG